MYNMCRKKIHYMNVLSENDDLVLIDSILVEKKKDQIFQLYSIESRV